jgi:hypothetical protein
MFKFRILIMFRLNIQSYPSRPESQNTCLFLVFGSKNCVKFDSQSTILNRTSVKFHMVPTEPEILELQSGIRMRLETGKHDYREDYIPCLLKNIKIQ